MKRKKDMLQIIFGRNLRRLRGERTQAEMARLIGVEHQQSYSLYENGRVPAVRMLHRIATRLGVTMDSFFATPSVEERKAASL